MTALRRAAPLLALAVAPLVGAAPAHAAAYRVTSCPTAVPSSDVIPANAFLQNYRAQVRDNCATGRGFGLQLGGPDILDAETVNGTVGFQISVPGNAPNTTITNAQFSLTVAGKSGDAASSGAMSIAPDDPTANRRDVVVWPGDRTAQLGPAFQNYSPGISTRRLYVAAHCATRCIFDELPDGSNFLVDQLKLTLDDSTAPTAPVLSSPPTTTLTAGTTFPMTVTATDADSGIASLTGTIDGGSSPFWAPIISGCFPVRAVVCAQSQALSALVPTGGIAAGLHTVRVVATDYAGNSTATISAPFTVAAAGGQPAPPIPVGPRNGDPKGTPLITTGKSSKKAAKVSSISTSWHRPVTITGRLLAADGSPMAGAQLRITQTLALKNATPTTLATITTDAKGAYTYRLIAASSGSIGVAYPTHVGGTDDAAARTIELAVRAHVTLRRTGPAKRGATMKFSGHVDATPIPPDGIRVALQYHSRNGGWLNADVITTGPSGNFTWKHSFRTAAAYRLRARVLADKQLAAAPANSAELHFRLR